MELNQFTDMRFVFDDQDPGHTASVPQFCLSGAPPRTATVFSHRGLGPDTIIPSYKPGRNLED
jgi:hypothetical protein